MNWEEKDLRQYIESNDRIVLSKEKKHKLILNLNNWEKQQANVQDTSENLVTISIKQTERSPKKKLVSTLMKTIIYQNQKP